MPESRLCRRRHYSTSARLNLQFERPEMAAINIIMPVVLFQEPCLLLAEENSAGNLGRIDLADDLSHRLSGCHYVCLKVRKLSRARPGRISSRSTILKCYSNSVHTFANANRRPKAQTQTSTTNPFKYDRPATKGQRKKKT